MARLIELQTNWKRGMKQDIPRTEMPDGAAWNIVDWIPDFDAALTGRGGWAYGSNALPTAVTAVTASGVLLDEATFSGTSHVTASSLFPLANKLYIAVVANRATGVLNTPTLTGGGGLAWVQMATQQVPVSRPWRITLFRPMRW